MKLIVGLGNPGTKYMTTRHNVGFEAIDTIAEIHGISVMRNKYKALIGEGMIAGEKVILMKPQTYMNLSGEAVAACMNFNKLTTDDLIVIYDDISLDLGVVKLKKSGSSGGHNGIKNIIAHLGTEKFPRIKFGVGQKTPGWDLADYVLSRFTEPEMRIIGPVFREVVDIVDTIVSEDFEKAMNKFNGKARG